MKSKLQIAIEGKHLLFMLDPEPSNAGATVAFDDQIVWCHPSLWEQLSSIHALLASGGRPKVKKGSNDVQ